MERYIEQRGITPMRILNIAGHWMEIQVRDHFFKKSSFPNSQPKLGWVRQEVPSVGRCSRPQFRVILIQEKIFWTGNSIQKTPGLWMRQKTRGILSGCRCRHVCFFLKTKNRHFLPQKRKVSRFVEGENVIVFQKRCR